MNQPDYNQFHTEAIPDEITLSHWRYFWRLLIVLALLSGASLPLWAPQVLNQLNNTPTQASASQPEYESTNSLVFPTQTPLFASLTPTPFIPVTTEESEPTPGILAQYNFDQAPLDLTINIPSFATPAQPNAEGETINLNLNLLAIPQDEAKAQDLYQSDLRPGQDWSGSYSIDTNTALFIHSGHNLLGFKLDGEELRQFLEGGTFYSPSKKLTSQETQDQIDILVGSQVQVVQDNSIHFFQITAVGNITHDQLESLQAEMGGEPRIGDLVRKVGELTGDTRFNILESGGNIIIIFCGTGPKYDSSHLTEWSTWSRWVVVLTPIN